MDYAYKVHLHTENPTEDQLLDLSEKFLDACESIFPGASFHVSGGPVPDETN